MTNQTIFESIQNYLAHNNIDSIELDFDGEDEVYVGDLASDIELYITYEAGNLNFTETHSLTSNLEAVKQFVIELIK